MTLTIHLTHQTEEWIRAEAQRQGVLPVDIIQKVLDDCALTHPINTSPLPDAENAAAIALLDKWRLEDFTDNPSETTQAEIELQELKDNLNKNRSELGERLVFP